MKTIKLIFAMVLMWSFNNHATAQEDSECNRYKAIAGHAYKAKEYEKVTWAYNKALIECGTLEMPFINPFLYSIKQSMSNAIDEEAKAAYLDTLIMVYEKAQEDHGMQKEWQSWLGYYYLMKETPENMKKADEAYKIGIYFDGLEVNKGFLQQYYANLINLWVQEEDEVAKEEYKKRIISEYFTLADIVNKADMGSEIADFLSFYLDKVVTDCASILPEINNFLQDLPKDSEVKKTSVKNFMIMLEDKDCMDSPEYEMLVDTIIAIDPSADAVLAKAKLQMSKGESSAAIATFNKAIEMVADVDDKSDIQYQIARIYYNMKSYRAAHDAGIAVKGKNAGKGYEIAARSVNALMNDCGVSTFERKANNYYAVELAQKSGNESLIASFQKQCPNSTDLFNAEITEGTVITLDCWGRTFPAVIY